MHSTHANWLLLIHCFLVGALLAVGGCALPGRAIPDKSGCLLQGFNATGEVLPEFGLQWAEPEGGDKRSLDVQNLPPKMVTRPIGVKSLPTTVLLSWATTDGIQHRKEIPISSVVPNVSRFKGGVVVRLFPEEIVKISWLTFDEYERGKNPELE